MIDCKFCDSGWNYCSKELYKKTDIYFMQNCLNHIYEKGNFIENLKNKIKYSKPKAIFILIDLNYTNAKKILKELYSEIKNSVKILSTNIQSGLTLSYCPVNMPQLLKEKIFIGDEGLIPKKKTYYYYVVFMKDLTE